MHAGSPNFFNVMEAKPTGRCGIMTQMSLYCNTGTGWELCRVKQTIQKVKRGDDPPKPESIWPNGTSPSSLALHKILVPYSLSILLPQTALFRFPTGPVIRQLGLVEQLPQPGRVLLVGKSEDRRLVLEVVQTDEYGIWRTGGPRACAR